MKYFSSCVFDYFCEKEELNLSVVSENSSFPLSLHVPLIILISILRLSGIILTCGGERHGAKINEKKKK